MSFFYGVTAQSATAVSRALKGAFTQSDHTNLLLVKGSNIDVFLLGKEGLSSVASIPICGKIAFAGLFRPPTLDKDRLVVVTDKYDLCVLEWDVRNHEIKVVAQGDMKERVGIPSEMGILGAICATLGVAAPSLVIITIIAAFLQNFADYPVIQDAFAGIQVCVCVLILRAVEKLWKKSVVDRPALVICVLVFLASAFLDLSPILLVILSAIAGVVLKTLAQKGGDRA